MVRTGRNQSVPEEQSSLIEASQLYQLRNELQALRDTVQTQSQTIETLQAQLQLSSQAHGSKTSTTFKAPPVASFSGKDSDGTTEKVSSFFYSIKKYGQLCNYTEEKMLELAECHFQDRAASWMLRLETDKNKPTSLEELENAMIEEFVTANEMATARVKLMDFHLKDNSSMDDHIAKFEDLFMLCGTQNSEVYIYFFNSLPKIYKGKFTERFPTSRPVDRAGNPSMQPAYDYARTLELAFTLAGEQQTSSSSGSSSKKNMNKSSNSARSWRDEKESRNATKDTNAVSWGPVKKGEIRLYMKNDRCFTCGKKGWSAPDHPCKKDRAEEKRPDHSKN